MPNIRSVALSLCKQDMWTFECEDKRVGVLRMMHQGDGTGNISGGAVEDKALERSDARDVELNRCGMRNQGDRS